jgi:hypothetical protein
MSTVAALFLVAALAAFIWAAFKQSVRWVAAGLALWVFIAAFTALAALLQK